MNGTALITGASSGIGLEMSRQLAEQKHALVLVARSGDKLQELAQTLTKEHGVAVSTFVCDLSKPNAAQDVFDFTKKNGLTIDLLINNAGIGVYGEHTEAPVDQLDGMLQLNIVALAELCRLFGADMRDRKSGRILNIASTAAYQPTPFFAAYGASKAFVLNFSEALAMELGDHGVTVSCLSPGPTDTKFFGGVDASGKTNAFFAERDDAKRVAEIAIDTMMHGSLSKIVGAKNYLRAFSGRFAPRSVVAKISKNVMKTT